MFLVNKIIAHRCYSNSFSVFEFPKIEIFHHPPNGLKSLLIPDHIIEQYSSTHKIIEKPLFNEAGLTNIRCDLGKNGLYHHILPPSIVMNQVSYNIPETHLNIYVSEDSMLYSFYNPTEQEILIIDAVIGPDTNQIHQKFKDNPKDFSIVATERNRIQNLSPHFEIEQDSDEYAFYSEGDNWFFSFDGKTSRSNNKMDGYVYIHTLLSNPNRSIPPWKLEHSLKVTVNSPYTDVPPIDIFDDYQINVSKDILFKEDDHLYQRNTKIQIKKFKKIILRIQNEIELAQEERFSENDEYVTSRMKKIEKLKDQKRIFQKNTGKNIASEKSRQNVQKSIQRSQKKLRKILPKLAEYLRIENRYKPSQRIETGNSCIYNVPLGEEILWKLY